MKQIIAGIYLLLSLSVFSLNAAEQFIYTRITFHDGLTSRVNSIYKEKDGDVWLGTPKGIYTFNGHDLSHHTDSLLHNRIILKIEEDMKGGIWVLTDSWLMHRRKGEENFRLLKTESP